MTKYQLKEIIKSVIREEFLTEGLSVHRKKFIKEGVGEWTIEKLPPSPEDTDIDADPWEEHAEIVRYEIIKNGKKVGELSRNPLMGTVWGSLFGKDLPRIDGYKSANQSGPLGNLHGFLKSETGRKWLSRVKQV